MEGGAVVVDAAGLVEGRAFALRGDVVVDKEGLVLVGGVVGSEVDVGGTFAPEREVEVELGVGAVELGVGAVELGVVVVNRAVRVVGVSLALSEEDVVVQAFAVLIMVLVVLVWWCVEV